MIGFITQGSYTFAVESDRENVGAFFEVPEGTFDIMIEGKLCAHDGYYLFVHVFVNVLIMALTVGPFVPAPAECRQR